MALHAPQAVSTALARKGPQTNKAPKPLTKAANIALTDLAALAAFKALQGVRAPGRLAEANGVTPHPLASD